MLLGFKFHSLVLVDKLFQAANKFVVMVEDSNMIVMITILIMVMDALQSVK